MPLHHRELPALGIPAATAATVVRLDRETERITLEQRLTANGTKEAEVQPNKVISVSTFFFLGPNQIRLIIGGVDTAGNGTSKVRQATNEISRKIDAWRQRAHDSVDGRTGRKR